VIEVADLADGGHAAQARLPDLARGQPDLGEVASLARSCAEPANNLATLPGTSSMLWMVVPSGMLASGRALPTLASALGPATTTSPTGAVGDQDVALLAVAVMQQAMRRLGSYSMVARRAGTSLVALEVDDPVRSRAAMADGQGTCRPPCFWDSSSGLWALVISSKVERVANRRPGRSL
jgi:hypothetical protein